jgi:L-fuconolactonase
MKIDSHHHFWKYSPEEYGWIDDAMKAIRRDFLPPDLEREIRSAGIDGVVSVQARTSLEETRFLLEFADRHDWIRGVVGWADLTDSRVGKALEEFKRNPKFKAVRHVLQGEPDSRYMLRGDFNRGVALLEDFGLAYDILIFERHLPQTLQFVDRHPSQVFVLDHIAKPRIKDNVLSPWQSRIVELAHRPNVYCKVSGMATEADYESWTPAQLKPYFDTALSAFGPRRLMFGSDWPVCLAAVEYKRWHDIVESWIAHLPAADQAHIMGGTAVEAYGL